MNVHFTRYVDARHGDLASTIDEFVFFSLQICDSLTFLEITIAASFSFHKNPGRKFGTLDKFIHPFVTNCPVKKNFEKN